MKRLRINPTALLRLLALLVLLFAIAAPTFESPVTTSTAAAKDKGHGKGNGKGNGSGKGNAERRDDKGDDDDKGHGKSDQEAKKKPKEKKPKKDKKDKKDKGNDERSAPEPVQVVVVEPATGYRVTVGCHTDAGRDETTCVFAGVALAEGEAVGGLAVPEGTVCTPVVAGDFVQSSGGTTGGSVTFANETTDWYTIGSGYRGPAFVSDGQPDVLTLVLAGTVETDGTATYWLQTEHGVAAATGPGLRCAPANTTTAAAPDEQTGAILVQAFTCPFETAPADAATLDWFAECAQPAPDATFKITALNDENTSLPRKESADDNGVVRVEDLPAGDYRLVQTDTDWCHAESDRVDDQGNVVVKPGERATVWIFDCTQAADFTLTPK
jgi:hypothetical protein